MKRMKKKILFVIDSLRCGGAEKSLVSLLPLLNRDKYEIHLWMLCRGGVFEMLLPDNVIIEEEPSYNLYERIWYMICHYRYSLTYRLLEFIGKHEHKAETLWKCMRSAYKVPDESYDIAVAYQQGFPTFIVASKVRASKKIAWVNINLFNARYNSSFISRYYDKMDVIVPVSKELDNILREGLPQYSEKYRIVYDILNPQLIKQQAKEPIDEISLFGNNIVLVTTGRVVYQKNHLLAVESAKILRDKGLIFKWLFVGDGEYRSLVEKKIHDYGLQDTVILLGERTNPYPYMARCTVYVQTSSFEGFGLTIAEAKILGRPVVSTNFDVVHDQLKHEKNGLIADMTAESVSENIMRMLTDEELRSRIIKNVEAEENLTYLTEAKNVEQILDMDTRLSYNEKGIMKNNISHFPDCYGCGVCAIACPKNIITLDLKDGFFQPSVRNEDCIECGQCLSVCAYNHAANEDSGEEKQFFAAYSNDEHIRKECSSGGVGYELAKYAINNGYSFCGVRYNIEKERAEHYVTDQLNGLNQGIGSKYIQSYTLTGFSQFEKGKKYFVVGTPCQIASLYHYIRKKKIEDDFILVDFFCHGVPSMLMWQKYMKEKKQQVGEPIKYVSWRNKQNGWQDSWAMDVQGERRSFSLKSNGDLFYKFFLRNRCLGRACYDHCKFKMVSSYADIRIGDLWGTKYEKDQKGVSGVVAFTEKGRTLIRNINDSCRFISESMEVTTESQMKTGAKKPSSYSFVYKKLHTEMTLSEIDKVASRIEKIMDELPWAMKYYPQRAIEIIRCKLGL